MNTRELALEANIIKLEELGMDDVEIVGGKNASLGEMISNLSNLGVSVPGGFATTAAAYREFLRADGLDDRIHAILETLDVDDIDALTDAGQKIRGWIMNQPLPQGLMDDIKTAWDEMSDGRDIAVAVRSSATAEDLPDASFAGQQETFLNIRGLDAVIDAMHQVFASLFNDRAIAYRVHQGFDHSLVALSAGIQTMVRSDIGSAGVMFTLDTESGFRGAVFITASYGLGETVVQGAVNRSLPIRNRANRVRQRESRPGRWQDHRQPIPPAAGRPHSSLLPKTFVAEPRDCLLRPVRRH